jgi:hypothetical protein
VLVGDYRDLFVAIATCAATLIGLLFVAMSIAQGRVDTGPREIREFRAAAALVAFTNAFAVTLFGLVPDTNVGYPAAIVGGIGVLFTAAGIRTILSHPSLKEQRRSQLALISALLVAFGFELTFGVELLVHPHRTSTIGSVSYVLIASLLIGIGRAWELVGEWDTGVLASIVRLLAPPASTDPAAHPERPDPPAAGGR